MASAEAGSAIQVISLTRRNVRMALAFPSAELVVVTLIARSLHPPDHAVSLAAFLLGLAILFGGRSAVAGMRVMELQQPGSVTNGMRSMSRVNVGIGVLMIAFGVWREIQ